MTNPWLVASVVALVVNLNLGVYVLRKNPRGAANRAFALLMGSFMLWDLGEAVLRYFSNGDVDHGMDNDNDYGYAGSISFCCSIRLAPHGGRKLTDSLVEKKFPPGQNICVPRFST